MNTLTRFLIIILVFILLMTIVLNYVEKDRIPLMADFFEKVLSKIPLSEIFTKSKNE